MARLARSCLTGEGWAVFADVSSYRAVTQRERPTSMGAVTVCPLWTVDPPYADAMQLTQRLLAPVGFAAVALCISLPFVAFRIVDPTGLRQTWTGFDLTIGGRSATNADDVSSDLSASVVAAGQPAFMIAIVLVMAGLAAAIL